MIITTHVKTKAAACVSKHYKALGYSWVGGNVDILVKTEDLLPNSNAYVTCQCNSCSKLFSTRYSRAIKKGHELCRKCYANTPEQFDQRSFRMKNLPSQKQIECRKLFSRSGKDHPRWNPKRPEIVKFTSRVHWLTNKVYQENKDKINPNNYPRTLCGTDGGYQLDHITSIKTAFLAGWLPEECAKVENLQMLPWEINRAKHAK